MAKPLPEEEIIYRALMTGVGDYVNKNRFPGVLLGLSGGIDSALVLAICVDALGAERVHAVMMPSDYTAAISVLDAHGGGVVGRHHHRVHALGAERVDDDREHQRRIHAAREPEQHAGKFVLVHVVASRS